MSDFSVTTEPGDPEATERLLEAAREHVAAMPGAESLTGEEEVGGEPEPAATTEVDDPPISTDVPVDIPVDVADEPADPAFTFEEPETPTAEPVVEDRVDYEQILSSITGGNLPDAKVLADVWDFAVTAAQLPPAQQEIINDVMAGTFDPAKYLPPQPQPQQREQFDDLDLDDPYQKQIAELRESQDAMRAELERREYAQQQQVLEAGYRAGASEFAEEYKGKLSATDMELLELQVTRSNVLPGLYAATRDPREATRKAFEQVAWSTPEFRQRLIDAQQGVSAEQQIVEQERLRRAAAVSGTGGVPAPARAPEAPRVAANLNEARRMAEEALKASTSFEAGNGSVD